MRKFLISLLFATVALVSCEKYDTIKEANNDFKYNFDLFWKLVDEQYCFLGYKNIDWNSVYDKMLPRVEAAKTEQEFFNVLEECLDYLRDGHVWMISPFKTYSCDTYLYNENNEKYPDNFDWDVVKDNYLKETFRVMDSKIYFGEIERDGRTYAYIYYAGFDDLWEDKHFKYIEPVVSKADGIIFDIRNNPGGSGEAGLQLAGLFMNKETHIGYYASKSGKGHDDFAKLSPLKVKPFKGHNWSGKKTMLLTNRHVYSTANLFTCALKQAGNVTQVGGISGGGGGMPATHYLANGWLVVFPSNVLFGLDKQHIEGGIAPDIEVTATDEELDEGIDSILERAIEELGK